ncbi:MAG TPA: DOMON-like domain-containing protein [Allosphingosinicella sp.]|nr:DOMON-like domain-containing protein [Allosphingosinicella sp.]
MQRLIRHPASIGTAVTAVEVELSRPAPRLLALRYLVTGPAGAIRLPPTRAPERADDLWQHTCFELFLANPPGYLELNFSPSTQWAAYRFDAPREGMRNAAIAAPKIETRIGFEMFELHAELAMPVLGPVGLAAVIEEKGGALSWWALAHPDGEPDFHHPDGFRLRLDPAH